MSPPPPLLLRPMPPPPPPRPPPLPRMPTMLENIDLSVHLDKADYDQQVKPLQNRLHLLAFKAYQQKRPIAIVFEGWDAAGKGGAIKRLTERIDPRGYV